LNRTFSALRKYIPILSVIFLLAFSAALALPGKVSAQDKEPVVITLFWGNGCPHCKAERPFLASIQKAYPNVEVRTYEVWYVETNIPIMKKVVKSFGETVSGVPVTIIGDKHWVGYDETQVKAEMEKAVAVCIKDGCPDPVKDVLTKEELAAGLPLTLTPEEIPMQNEKTSQLSETPVAVSGDIINVPFIGAVDLEKQSLAVATLLIGFVDGVNPCSIWALTMLLAITLHTGSRKKVMIIGLVFITVTAGVYALFILGIFSALTLLSSMGWIQVVVSLVALFFAVVNIKDYFWYKEGLSFTIADDKKPGLFQKMRKIVDASDSFWGLVGATVVLAAGVSLVEFACTAGFPVIWTNLLSAQKVTPLTFTLLLLLYLLIYQLDELGIFAVAVVTLKSSKIEEKHGRILKLIGGTLMLALSIAMLVDPFIMNNMSSSLIVFGAAMALTLVVLLLHRRVLPAMGIYIGTEMKPRAKNRRKK
jgi:thiol-disulfide isomerase/thioredoxin